MEKNDSLYHNIHQELIDGCRKGDEKAQFQIYKLYYRAMFNTSLRIVNDATEAEDIMQESFLAAFNKIETYRGSVSFGAWLKKIVVNRSLDHIKKRKLEFDDLDERSVADGESITGNEFVSDGKNEEMYAARIKEAIDQLPEGYRIVLSLYLLEGYDHEEIGDILGITSSTSRSQFTRARKKLIENLNQQNAS